MTAPARVEADGAEAPTPRTPHEARIWRERERLLLATGARARAEAEAAIARLTAHLHAAPDPLRALATRLGLERRAEDFLALALATATDPASAAALARLQGGSSVHGVTVGTYAALAGAVDDARALALALATDHPLVREGLVESASDALVTPASRVWAASPRLARHLEGDGTPAAPLARLDEPALALFDEAQRARLDELARLLADDAPVTLVLEGPAGSGRASAVATVARTLGRPAVALALDRLAQADDLDAAVRALRREVALAGAIPVIRGVEELAGPDAQARRRRLEQLVGALAGPVVLTTTLPGQPLRTERDLVREPWGPCAPASRRALWSVLLADADPEHAVDDDALDRLAQRHAVAAGTMAAALRGARAATAPPLTEAAVIAALRQRTAEELTGLTTQVTVAQGWDDLVLASDTREQIEALIARVRLSHQVLDRWGLGRRVGRARGTVALFSGAPGTGKTMVAGLVARELGLELHQVDLAQVLSKWIGETEKQLARIFDAAATGHTLLLFDEADALFTRRTEVRSSNDRYANLEVNFLLQRLEAFDGVVILTTNLDGSIDPAFKRRLAAHVVFAPPDEDERERLWRSFLGGGVPVAPDVDVGHLVREFADLTGAHIRNVVLGAAYAAAARGQPIGQATLEAAARGEYAAMGRVLARGVRGR